MELKDEIKSYIAISGLTLTDIQKELNNRNGTNYSVQNLSKKINSETLRYSELKQIADILGFNITWVRKDNSSIYNGNKEYNDFMIKMNNIMHYTLYAMQNIPPEIMQKLLTDGNIDPIKLDVYMKTLEKK